MTVGLIIQFTQEYFFNDGIYVHRTYTDTSLGISG